VIWTVRQSCGKINAINSSGSYIPAETKLAVTIRWLAGGIHHDICDLFGLSPQNFFHKDGPLWPTIEAINEELVLGFPMDEQELDKISEGFARYSHDRINGCVLAVDGILIRTKCPRFRHKNLLQSERFFWIGGDCWL
jgi:hypothetical protein